MLSLPEDWEYSVAGLSKMAGCGKDKLRRILGELENVGYLAREQSHDSGANLREMCTSSRTTRHRCRKTRQTGKPVDGFTRHRETPTEQYI